MPASVTFLADQSFAFSDIENLFYQGTHEQWDSIESDRYHRLVPENLYFYSENEPLVEAYKFWRYVDGVMTPWAEKTSE